MNVLEKPLLAKNEHWHELGAVADRELHEPEALLEHHLVL